MDEGDLMSVVLGCAGGNPTTAPPPSSDPLAPLFSITEMESLAMAAFDFPAFSMMNGGLEDLFVPSSPPQPPLLQQQQQQKSLFLPTSLPSSMIGSGFVHPKADMVVPQPPPPQLQAVVAAPVQKSKKNQQKKKVNTHISPYINGPDDCWAWHKYGQKPIKGYPYPRSYYRCITVKSCPARKQVEKSWANQGMYTITYTEDHTHPPPTSRSCLAGSICDKKGCASMSPTTPLVSSSSTDEESDDNDEEGGGGMLMVEDMEIVGEEELLFIGDWPNAASSSATSAASMEVAAKRADATALMEGEEKDPFFDELWETSRSFFINGGENY